MYSGLSFALSYMDSLLHVSITFSNNQIIYVSKLIWNFAGHMYQKPHFYMEQTKYLILCFYNYKQTNSHFEVITKVLT